MTDRKSNAPVSLACIACRTSKTRCDGKQPCQSCAYRGRECYYQPSRRGGRRPAKNILNQTPKTVRSERTATALEAQEPAGSETIAHHNSSSASSLHHFSPRVEEDSIHDDTSASIPRNVAESTAEMPFCSAGMRAYRSKEDIVHAYYSLIHPIMPVLPPPTTSFCLDQPVSLTITDTHDHLRNSLPYWPTCQVSLAMSALLVLMPLPHDIHPMESEKVMARRFLAQSYARAAFELVEGAIDKSELLYAPYDQEKAPASKLHTGLPTFAEPILALNILALYEYCQRGKTSVMRARINLGVTLAMDLGLHKLDAEPGQFAEGLRRAWWCTMLMMYNSSCLASLNPIVNLDDSRIITPYPHFNESEQLWSKLLKSTETLFMTQQVVREIEDWEHPTSDFVSLLKRLREIDDLIVSLTTYLNQNPQIPDGTSPEARAVKALWSIARIVIHTCRIKLHGPWAMMDVPVFLNEHCYLASIDTHGLSTTTRSTLVPDLLKNSLEPPFTTESSTRICLSSAFAIARIVKRLPTLTSYMPRVLPGTMVDPQNIRVRQEIPLFPHTPPYFMCSAMNSCQALLVVLHKVRNAQATGQYFTCSHLLGVPDSATDYDEAERLSDEIKTALESLRLTLEFEAVYEGIKPMADEVHNACIAAFGNFNER